MPIVVQVKRRRKSATHWTRSKRRSRRSSTRPARSSRRPSSEGCRGNRLRGRRISRIGGCWLASVEQSRDGVSRAVDADWKRTRLSGVWVSVIVGVVVFVFLLVFILQNTKSVKVSFLTVSGSMPLGVALLLAAIGGVLLAGLVASLRIWQLRHRLHKSNSGAADRPLA